MGVPIGPESGSHFEALRHFNAVLRDRLVVDESRHFVYSAEIFRNGETRIETAGGIDIESPSDVVVSVYFFPLK